MEELESFLAGQLGPASLERMRAPELRSEWTARLRKGSTLEDAALHILHREASHDRLLADEFLAHFLHAMNRIGHYTLSANLQRFLDTGDLVNSVAGNLWSDMSQFEFRTRGEFLAYLGKRLSWKASDRARQFAAGKRREEKQTPLPEGARDLPERDQAGPGTLAGDAEERDRLILVLLRLPERDREILKAHLRGDSHAEVAESLGLKPEAARKALQRAIQHAREML